VGRERRVAPLRGVEGVEGARIALEDLGHRGRRIGGSGFIVDPDVERRPPKALARQRPVDVVAEEVAEAPLLDVLRKPFDLVVVGQRLRHVRGRPDVPGRAGVLDQCIVLGAHAEGILVANPLEVPQQTPCLELAREVAIALLHPAAGVGRVGDRGIEAAVREDRAQEREIGIPLLLAAQQLEVHLTEGGCDVDDAGARVELDEVRSHDPPVGEIAAAAEEPVEGRRIRLADQIGAGDPALHGEIASHPFGQRLA
jgi:hypothetical protein